MTTKLATGVSVRLPSPRQKPESAVAGSIQTYYCNDPIQSGSSAGLLTPTQPTASTSLTGWTVGTTVATRYSRQSYNVKIAAGNFTATLQPSGPPITASSHIAEDCWRISAATSGIFSRGTWYSSVSIIAVTNASSQQGRARFRLWRSTDVGGANAIEITDSSQPVIGAITGALSTSVATSSFASFSLPAIGLSSEFLFLQVAWETTMAGGNASADALIRYGSIALASGSGLVTSAFSGTVAAGGGGAVSAGNYFWRKWLESS